MVSTEDMRAAYLPGVERHSIGLRWRTDPPPYEPGMDWGRECMNAVIDCLTAEGIPAWPGDATSCVVQIIEAYAKRTAVENRERKPR